MLQVHPNFPVTTTKTISCEPAKYHYHPFKFWAEQIKPASKPFWKTKKEKGHFVLREAWRVGIEYSALNNCILLTKRLTVPLIKWEKLCVCLVSFDKRKYTFHTEPGQLFTRFGCFVFGVFFWYYTSAQNQTDYQFPGKSVDREEVPLFMLYLPSFQLSAIQFIDTLELASSYPFEKPKFQI